MLIETGEAIADIDAIVDTPGIDVVVIAPFDLSSSLGVEGQFDSPVFAEAVATVERAARNRLPLAGVALARKQSTALTARGYRLQLNGFDVLMLEQSAADFADWR